MGKYISKTIIIALILCSVCFVTYKFYDVSNVEDTSTKNIKQNNNMLSMMIETEARSGKYELTPSSSWPTDSYVFNESLSKCENGGTLSWDDTNKKVVFEGNNIDKCYVYFNVYAPPSIIDYCTSGQSLSSCITTFGNQGSDISNIYIHDSNLENGAGDNSYRFAGANPNNYVCFGSDDATCPHENLYRIIGLIDGKIKLILSDGATTDMLGTDGGYYNTYSGASYNSSGYKGNGDLSKIGIYYWNKIIENTWSSTTTNTTNLNTNFLTYLDTKNTKWKEMIDDTTWYVGGLLYNNAAYTNAKTTYDYELGTNKGKTTITSKIGMMYLSEYYYGAAPEYWAKRGFDVSNGEDYRKAKDYNWLCIGLPEWTISRSTSGYNALCISANGALCDLRVDTTYVVRQSFNLISSVTYVSGTGTSTDPIRVK